jgi:hypothetical protein
MTVPLIVLAALSVIGGFFNVEHVPIVKLVRLRPSGGRALHHWLHPVIEGAEERDGPRTSARWLRAAPRRVADPPGDR